MVAISFVFFTVLALTLLSGSAAIAVVLMADTKAKPYAALVVRRLLQTSLLGSAALIALLGVD